MKNVIDHQQYNNSDTSVPKEIYCKVENTYNDMEEESQDDK